MTTRPGDLASFFEGEVTKSLQSKEVTKTVCSGAMQLRVIGGVRAEAIEKQAQNIRISHPENTHSKHSFSTLSYSLYHKTNKALDEFANAVVFIMYSILCKTYDSKRYAFKSKMEKLG